MIFIAPPNPSHTLWERHCPHRHRVNTILEMKITQEFIRSSCDVLMVLMRSILTHISGPFYSSSRTITTTYQTYTLVVDHFGFFLKPLYTGHLIIADTFSSEWQVSAI